MKRMFLFVLGCLLISASYGFAEPIKKHTLAIAPEVSNIVYKEPGVMKEEGMMYGVSGFYAYHNALMLKAEGRASFGEVDYTSDTTGEIDDIEDYILEIRGLVGYDFPISENLTVTPLFGLGYRYLNDDTSGRTSSTNAAGYERESNYFYSPIGFEVLASLKESWSLGAAFEYDIFWWGVQESHLSGAVAGLSDLENDQTEGYGLRGSIKLQKKSERVDYFIEPFIRYWNIEESDNANVTYNGVIVGYGFEPKNNSTEFGLKMGVVY